MLLIALVCASSTCAQLLGEMPLLQRLRSERKLIQIPDNEVPQEKIPSKAAGEEIMAQHELLFRLLSDASLSLSM